MTTKPDNPSGALTPFGNPQSLRDRLRRGSTAGAAISVLNDLLAAKIKTNLIFAFYRVFIAEK